LREGDRGDRDCQHLRGHLRHSYSVISVKVMMTIVRRAEWWLQINHTSNTWSSSFFVNSNLLSRNNDSISNYEL